MSDLKGRTFLVTGANTGIGRVAAEHFAKRGARVVLACRSLEKTQAVLDAIKSAGGDAEFLKLDLGSFESIRSAAAEFLARKEPLHVLVNNAGLAGHHGKTKDGFELQIGTNHLGPFLFTNLLLPLLRETPGRIVNVSSGSHYAAKSIPYDRFRDKTWSLTGMQEYEISKLCNVLFTKSLARDEANKGIGMYSLHPGTIATDIWRSVPGIILPLLKWAMKMKTVEEGAQTTIYCATSDACANENGLYYTDRQVKKPSRLARDESLADELWKKSAELVSL
jgi:NAD(P)-dependent dehydrogenase (short-subunit alcohol dehydrogenase family)